MHNYASKPFTQTTIPHFEVKQSAKLNLTSYPGLALIGQGCQAAQGGEAVIDQRLPVSQSMRTSALVKSMVGLLSLGKSDFEAIAPFRGDRFLNEALGLAKVAGRVWMRQRLDARAAELRELTNELSVRLLERLFDYLTKWNPRRQDETAWVARAEAAGVFEKVRAGKRVGLLDLKMERAWKKAKRTLRLVVRVTERTIDEKGQQLPVPEIEIEG